MWGLALASTGILSSSTGSSTTVCTIASSRLDDPHDFFHFCHPSTRATVSSVILHLVSMTFVNLLLVRMTFVDLQIVRTTFCDSPARKHDSCEFLARTHDFM